MEKAQKSILSMISEVGAAITSSLVLEEVLSTIAQTIAEALDVWECDLYEWVPERDELICAAMWALKVNAEDEDWVGSVYSLRDYPSYLPIIAGEVAVDERTDDGSLDRESVELMRKWGEKATLTVPLTYEGQPIGCLTVIEKRTLRKFTSEEKELLTQLALPAAVAIHNAKMYRAQEDRSRELASLLDSLRAITSTVIVEDVLDLVARKAAEALDVPATALFEYVREIDAVVMRSTFDASRDIAPDDSIGTPYSLDDYPADRRILAEGEPVQQLISDETLDSATRESMLESDEKSCLTVPLRLGSEPVGLLEIIETRYERRFSEAELELARGLGEQAAVAIHNARLYRRQEEQNRGLVALFDASQKIADARDLEDLLHGVAVEAENLVKTGGVGATVSLEDGERQLIYAGPGADARPEDQRSGSRAKLLRTVAKSRRPAQAELGDGRWMLVVPLTLGKKVGGHIEVIAQIRRAFDEMEVEILQILASQAAIAVEKLRATARNEEQREQLAKLNARLNAFVETSEELRGLADEETILVVLGRVMADALEFRQGVAYVYEPEERAFRIASTFGGSDEVEEKLHDSVIPERIFAEVLASATIVSGSFFIDHRHHEWTAEQRKYFPGWIDGEWEEGMFHSDDTLLVPMIGERDQLIGYIEAYDPIDRQLPSENVVRLLEVFAGKAAAAIELQRAYQQLSEQARTDGLTGLYNHRCLDERLEEEIARARRYRSPLSVLMLDIDHFKPFNDTYGHPQGDKLLRAMADVLRESTRLKTDIIARYGGEEFVIVLPNTPATGAEALADRVRDSVGGERSADFVAERIRATMEERAFEGFPNRRDARVTVSLGVASYPDHGKTADELVANADKALYLAKRLGRNCVQVFH